MCKKRFYWIKLTALFLVLTLNSAFISAGEGENRHSLIFDGKNYVLLPDSSAIMGGRPSGFSVSLRVMFPTRDAEVPRGRVRARRAEIFSAMYMGEEGVGLLEEALLDESPLVRKTALAVFAATSAGELPIYLEIGLADEDASVREIAARLVLAYEPAVEGIARLVRQAEDAIAAAGAAEPAYLAGGSYGRPFSFFVRGSTAFVRIRGYDEAGRNLSQTISARGLDIEQNRWHHMCFTYCYEKGRTRLYFDGEKIITMHSVGVVKPMHLPLRIGREGGYSGSGSQQDDFRIYSSVLSAEQVEKLYAGAPPEDAREAGWWKMNEGEGDDVRDSSGNGHHGVLAPADNKPAWSRLSYMDN